MQNTNLQYIYSRYISAYITYIYTYMQIGLLMGAFFCIIYTVGSDRVLAQDCVAGDTKCVDPIKPTDLSSTCGLGQKKRDGFEGGTPKGCAPLKCIGKTDAYCNCIMGITPVLAPNSVKNETQNKCDYFDCLGQLGSPQRGDEATCACYANGGTILNTNVPRIGRCISSSDTSQNAAFSLLGGLGRMLMTLILVGGFVGLVIAGAMIASSGNDEARQKKGIKLIKSIIIGIAALGLIGTFLRIINPNFFK